MGDGGIALILDVAASASVSGMISSADRRQALPNRASQTDCGRSRLDRSFCSAQAAFERLAIPLARWRGLENIPAAQVEFAAGRTVVQYRNRVLPLVSVAEMLGAVRRPETRSCTLSFTETACGYSAWWWTKSWISSRKP